MNDKNTGRRFCEQLCTGNTDILSGVATRKRYAAGLIAGLLLAGAAHATDIVIPAGAHNGQVVYSYNPGPTSPMTVTNSREHSWFRFCAVGVNYMYPDLLPVIPRTYGIAHYGLAIRQVSGAIVGKSDDYSAIPNAGVFRADGTTADHPASGLMTNKNAVGVHLDGGRVEVYVEDQRLLPTENVKVATMAYRVGMITFTQSEAPTSSCPNVDWNTNTPDTQSMQSGPFRYPTPDGNVTLVVNNPTARTKVHNACQTGGHAGTCQRIHNFAVTHHKR